MTDCDAGCSNFSNFNPILHLVTSYSLLNEGCRLQILKYNYVLLWNTIDKTVFPSYPLRLGVQSRSRSTAQFAGRSPSCCSCCSVSASRPYFKTAAPVQSAPSYFRPATAAAWLCCMSALAAVPASCSILCCTPG